MKANELRIGNFISIEGVGSPMQSTVTAIEQDKIFYTLRLRLEEKTDFLRALMCYIQPVLLTEEWLIKLGAMIIGDNTYTLDRFKLIWKSAYKYWYVVDGHSLTYLTKLDFVHEWQNFYFAMQGKELEIK